MNEYHQAKSDSNNASSSPDMPSYVRAQIPNPETLKDINRHRKEASVLYDPSSYAIPSIIFSNDGTGFGKSYGVIDTYIEGVKQTQNAGESHQNLFFITPQKAQIDFPDELIRKAYKAGIEFVSFLARDDLKNLQFESWVPGHDGEKKTNLTRYKRWSIDGSRLKKQKRQNSLTEGLIRLGQVLDNIHSTEQALESMDSEAMTSYGMTKAALEDQLETMRRNLETVLGGLAKEALVSDGQALSTSTIKEIIANPKSQSPERRLRAEIIRHLVPFAVAMVKPCIMLATTKKFDTKTKLPRLVQKRDSDQKIWKLKHLPFECILGGKEHVERNNAGAYAEKSHAEQMAFLKAEAFAVDEDNYFREHNIRFTLVIDEEHEAHDIFRQSSKAHLIDQEVLLPHVYAVIHRLYHQVSHTSPEESRDIPLYKEKRAFVDKIKETLIRECDLKPDVKLGDILDMFSGNVDFAFINSGDVEQIINITRNVFSFTPKRYLNENELKCVRLKSVYAMAGIQLYYSTDTSDSSPSLYDMYQVTLAILYACANLKQNDNLIRYLNHAKESSHNQLICKFISKAQQVRSEVDHLFDRSEENLEINHFFTYFQPKTIFSIIKDKNLEYSDPSLKNKTLVKFTLDLMKEQPEVMLLRALYDTQNTVICLSATSGFDGNITGQFNRQFLHHYCTKENHNFGITLVHRSPEDADKLAKIRQHRAQLRKATFTPFDVTANRLKPKPRDPTYEAVFNHWKTTLSEFVSLANLRHTYRGREFERSLDSLLTAAFDGRHTLILSLSGLFISALRNYLKKIYEGKEAKPKKLEILEKSRVFEITLFDNGVRLRVILFNAAMAREVDVRKFTRIEDPHTKIAFLAPYKSAGTGLNYFISQCYRDENNQEQEFEVDFERLILVNAPYFSSILNDDEDGSRLHSLNNFIALLKWYANEPDVKLLKDFKVNLVNGEDYRFLMREHTLEKFKVMMQAIGRIERKDARIDSGIFLPDEMFNSSMLLFARLKRNPANKTVFSSMSLLNYRLMEHCAQAQTEVCFKDQASREKFEERMKEADSALKNFLTGQQGEPSVVSQILERARQGNKTAIRFNEALRDIASIEDPEKYLNTLKDNPIIAKDTFYQSLINHLYFIREGDLSKIVFCRSDQPDVVLTDIEHGDDLYEPEKLIVVDYSQRVNMDTLTPVAKLFRASQKITKKAFIRYVPHPAFIAHLKGNMGEYLVRKLIELVGPQPIPPLDIMHKIGPRAYELFDLYIENAAGQLLCIDVKNWSSTLDKHDMSLDTHEKSQGKIETIMQYVKNRYQDVKFIYVNARFDHNSLNVEQEIDSDRRVYYLNLFREDSGYRSKDQRGIGHSELKKILVINDHLMTLLSNE